MKKEKMVTITISLPESTVKKLDSMAKKLKISRNDLIIKIVREYLKENDNG